MCCDSVQTASQVGALDVGYRAGVSSELLHSCDVLYSLGAVSDGGQSGALQSTQLLMWGGLLDIQYPELRLGGGRSRLLCLLLICFVV